MTHSVVEAGRTRPQALVAAVDGLRAVPARIQVLIVVGSPIVEADMVTMILHAMDMDVSNFAHALAPWAPRILYRGQMRPTDSGRPHAVILPDVRRAVRSDIEDALGALAAIAPADEPLLVVLTAHGDLDTLRDVTLRAIPHATVHSVDLTI